MPGEEQHNSLRIHLIRKFNWTRIGTIYLTKAKYTLAHNQLIHELDKIVNVTISRSILENQNSNQYETILNEFITEDIKIIIGLFDYNTTFRLFCEVYKKNMYGKNYQWIILGTDTNRFLFSNDIPTGDCTREQIFIALNGTLQTRIVQYAHEYKDRMNQILNSKFKHENQNNEFLDFKIDKSAKFESYYQSIVDSYLSTINNDIKHLTFKNTCYDSYFHGYAFDLILSIFKTLSVLIESKNLSCQKNDNMFERNIEWFSLLINTLNRISFKGVTVIILKICNTF